MLFSFYFKNLLYELKKESKGCARICLTSFSFLRTPRRTAVMDIKSKDSGGKGWNGAPDHFCGGILSAMDELQACLECCRTEQQNPETVCAVFHAFPGPAGGRGAGRALRYLASEHAHARETGGLWEPPA